MRALLIAFLAFLPPLSSFATVELRVGDILLQPLHCWVCMLIEAEDKSIYSHMGIVISTNPVLVAESINRVEVKDLAAFNAKTESAQKLGVLRIKNKKFREKFQNENSQLRELFKKFEGKKYDREFLWDNVDENGDELYYCSEFITKFLESFLEIQIPLKRMHFKENRKDWEIYFSGKVPDGEWGNSPAQFFRSPMFEFMGEL